MSGSSAIPAATATPMKDDSRLSFPIGVFLLSLFAFPICYLLNLNSAMGDSPRLIFLAGVVICVSVAPVTYFGIVRGVPAGRDFYFYVFTIFAFTSLVDLTLALTIDGYNDWTAFYLKEGEVYLTTAHGLWINLWDGTFHYGCYLLLTSMLLRASHSYSEVAFRTVALVWAGSILNSLIVLFAGSAIGLHAPDIKPSYLLNIPYALFPAIFLWRVLQSRPPPAAAPVVDKSSDVTPVTGSTKKPILSWLIDLPLIVIILLAVSLCIFRALVVVGSRLPLAQSYGRSFETHLLDSVAYPMVQMLTYAYFLVPYLVWSLIRVWSGASSLVGDSFSDATLVALGAVLQGEFSYIGAAIHPGAAYPSEHHQPQTSEVGAIEWFILANGIIVVTPILILIRMVKSRGAAAGCATTQVNHRKNK